MGWWQITSDMYNGDEVADVLTDALDPVIATVAGIYQREFGRMPFQEELKSAVDFVVYSSIPHLPERGVAPQHGSGLGYGMSNMPGLRDEP